MGILISDSGEEPQVCGSCAHWVEGVCDLEMYRDLGLECNPLQAITWYFDNLHDTREDGCSDWSDQ